MTESMTEKLKRAIPRQALTLTPEAAQRADDIRAKAWAEADTETDRERVERAGYPEHIDYEALILAEDEDW